MGQRIIVVDAEPIIRKTVAGILERDGYDVIQASDPLAVVESIKSAPPALIITNVSLPGITGHDAMKIFKEHAPHVPVLMIPGLPDSEVIREWKDREGFDIFPKPFSAHDLSAKVREMITLPESA